MQILTEADKRTYQDLKERKRKGTLQENEKPYLEWFECGGKRPVPPIIEKCNSLIIQMNQDRTLYEIAGYTSYSTTTIQRLASGEAQAVNKNTARTIYNQLKSVTQ